MPTNGFYDRLATVTDFTEVADPKHYVPVPDNWLVAVGDVRDSTGAIEEGQYKDVNVVGASLIAATLNAVGHRGLPYTFAGDGAALCVPPESETVVRRALAGTRAMARDQFGLRLCVGLVPVSDLRDAGDAVQVARYRLSDSIEQSMFIGRGLYQAEEWVKTNPEGPFGIAASVPAEADFTGVQCRWRRVPSRKDEIVTLLVHATAPSLHETAHVYEDIIDRLRAIYGDDDGRPILHGQLRMGLSPQVLATEQRVQTHGAGALQRVRHGLSLWLQTLLGRVLMWAGWETAEADWGRYRKDLAAHTDDRKMDGTLRQVVAGTTAQRRELEAFLSEQYEAGRLVYGLDASDAAMVTCLVFRYDREHVHFVDGAEGGYAHAAQTLKSREAALA
jgi:hypothetical protein